MKGLGGHILAKQGVISLGEAFIDFISKDQTNRNYIPLLGGATVNVAVGISRFGLPSYYLCKLGIDTYSHFVEKELEKEQVNIDYCIRTPGKEICGVYININENGERSFHSYRNPTPDEVLTECQLKEELFEKASIFYFGSGTLFHNVANKTTEKAIQYAKEHSTLIAFDTNIRIKRWESEEHCRKTICSFLKKADIVKMAEDELLFLTKSITIDEGLQKIAQWRIPFLFVTLGEEGACALYEGEPILIPAKKVNAIDTTGAGDAFMASLLYSFHEKGKPNHYEQVMDYIENANKWGALTAAKLGSL